MKCCSIVFRAPASGCCLLLTAVIFIGGCASRVPTYPTRGKVVYKDGQPLRGEVWIWFESTSPPYHRSSAKIDANGEFELSFDREGNGAPEGEQRVRFDPGGEHMQASAEIALAKIMPPRYLEFSTSGLKQTIVRGPNEFVIEIERPSRR